MKIKQVEIEKLIPYINNSRTHDDAQVAQIAASIKEFGWTNPILTDGDNGIIAGHGRLMAARKLGMTTVPVIELEGMTEAQKKAYVIADNKLALNAGWDLELLALEIGELQDMAFDMSVIGFSDDEIAELNYEAIDIDEVDKFNEKFNVQISCDDLIEVAEVQRLLGITGKKITAKKIIEALQ
jgi:ParB-like chromosome segregation protein Spo0J